MTQTRKQTAIIIGAGSAGLTAAYELATKTKIKPIVFEASNDIGGISKTVNYKGNRIDIGQGIARMQIGAAPRRVMPRDAVDRKSVV